MSAVTYVAPQQGMSTLGWAVSIAMGPWFIACIALGYQEAATWQRAVTAIVAFAPAAIWEFGALLGPSKFTGWFYRAKGVVTFDAEGVHWDIRWGHPVSIPWASIARVSLSPSPAIVQSETTWVSVPRGFRRIQTTDGREEFTFAMALVRSYPQGFVLDASRGDPPEQARRREPDEPASDTRPLVPLIRSGYRGIGIVLLVIFVVSLAESLLHAQ